MAGGTIIDATNGCGCCEGIAAETPGAIFNRPGLSAIAYRAGTHQQFKATLLTRLHSSRQPALLDLRTRDDDDFTIALCDALATVADVLTFYTERIANEAYLRTAVERRSVLELAQNNLSSCLSLHLDCFGSGAGADLVQIKRDIFRDHFCHSD